MSIKHKDMDTVMEKATMKSQLKDIALEISWAKLSQRYFGRSASWIYHKIDGIDGNGKTGEFSDSEKEQLRGALYDLSERIRKTAMSIK
jgi:hypothetical protein